MLSKEFNIVLDIKRQIKVEQMTVVQGDLNSNVINIKLENDGKEYDLTGTKVEIVFAKPDNTTVLQSDIAMINEKEGQIRCVLKTNTIAAPGVVIAEVRVRSAEDDKLLTSAQFRLHVRKSLMSDEVIESTDDFGVLTELIKEVEGLIEEVGAIDLDEFEQIKKDFTELEEKINAKEEDRDKLYNETIELKTQLEQLQEDLLKRIGEVEKELKNKWGKDELELGGRNYLTQKDQEKIARYNDFITTESKQENGLYAHEIVTLTDVTVRAAIPVYDYQHFAEGDDITVSCDIKSTEELLVKLAQTTEDEYKVVKPNEWVRVSSKVDYGDRIGIYTENQAREGAVINVKNYKLEKGNIATPFSLAPEDEDKIATQTSPLANLDHVDKVDKQVAENTKMKWGKDELELGGRNYLINSDLENHPRIYQLSCKKELIKDNNVYSGEYLRLTNLEFTGASTGFYFYSLENSPHITSDIRGKNVLITFEMRADGNMVLALPPKVQVDENYFEIDSNWRRISTTIKYPEEGNLHFYFRNPTNLKSVEYTNFKIEKSNIATPWTPAPEDLEGIQTQPAPLANMAHIEYLENQIKELREMIALRGLSR